MKKFLVTVASLVSLAACGDSGSGGIGTGIALKATSSAAPAAATRAATGDLAGVDAGGTAIVVDTARVVVRKIEVEFENGVRCSDLPEGSVVPPVRCESEEGDDDDKLVVEGPFLVDLMTGLSTPSLQGLTIPAGNYKKLEIEFEDADEDDTEDLLVVGDPLQGNTLYASGSFVYDGVPRTFELMIDFHEEVEFENLTGIDLAALSFSTLVVQLDVAQWFSAAPITECLDDGDLSFDGDHVVVSDESGCSGVEEAIKNAFEASGQFEIDDHGNDDDGSDDADDDSGDDSGDDD